MRCIGVLYSKPFENFIAPHTTEYRYKRAYEPWNKEEEKRLSMLYKQGATIQELAQELQRQPGGIRARLKKLGLTE